MMKLLLTSAGLANKNIRNEFLRLVNKTIQQVKILFVTVAARTKEELKYVDKSEKELLDLGVNKNYIKIVNLDALILFDEIKNFDVIYICGGNTFYLLKKIRETGFDKVIIKFVKAGKLYFGVSAGSIIAGSNIKTAGIGLSPDINDVSLIDLSGLNLINFVISPHYCEEEKIFVDRLKKNLDCELVPLTDSQALLIFDKEIKIIE